MFMFKYLYKEFENQIRLKLYKDLKQLDLIIWIFYVMGLYFQLNV